METSASTTATTTCAICSHAKKREFAEAKIIPGLSMSIVRETPTAAVVRVKGGSVEPAHHHTFGHDLLVLKGFKRVWNLSKNQSFDLGPGDYLYTPAPDIHRVQYFTDTEFFIRWDGQWDLFFDEDLEAATSAIKATEQNVSEST